MLRTFRYRVQKEHTAGAAICGSRDNICRLVAVPTGTTQELRIRIVDDLIEVSLNGRKLSDARDRTFQKSGAVGIWTKADSVTAFYELNASVLKG
jgi:hypothetical protein